MSGPSGEIWRGRIFWHMVTFVTLFPVAWPLGVTCHVTRRAGWWLVAGRGSCVTLWHIETFLFTLMSYFQYWYQNRDFIHPLITLNKILPSRLCYDHLGAKTEEFLPKFLRLQTTNNLRSTLRGKSLSFPICGEISSCVHRSYYSQIQLWPKLCLELSKVFNI